MHTRRILGGAKVRSQQAGSTEEAPTSRLPHKADAADRQQSPTPSAPAASHDTPHEAKPEQPKASLTNRLFRTMKAAPKPQPALEMSRTGHLSHKF